MYFFNQTWCNILWFLNWIIHTTKWLNTNQPQVSRWLSCQFKNKNLFVVTFCIHFFFTHFWMHNVSLTWNTQNWIIHYFNALVKNHVRKLGPYNKISMWIFSKLMPFLRSYINIYFLLYMYFIPYFEMINPLFTPFNYSLCSFEIFFHISFGGWWYIFMKIFCTFLLWYNISNKYLVNSFVLKFI